MESNRAARTMFDTLLENCIFYISQLYEFSHRLGHSRHSHHPVMSGSPQERSLSEVMGTRSTPLDASGREYCGLPLIIAARPAVQGNLSADDVVMSHRGSARLPLDASRHLTSRTEVSAHTPHTISPAGALAAAGLLGRLCPDVPRPALAR